MAPEQAAAGRSMAAATCSAWAAFCTNCLTGQMAFAGPSLMSVLSALANHHPRSPRDVLPNVPESLSDLTDARLLEKSPDSRPESASDVSNELRRIERSFDGNAATGDSRPRL